jgi:hypothetical protein
MAIAAKRLTQTTRCGPGWRLIACLVLVAFVLQSQITQTHTHDIWPGFGQSAISGQHLQTPSPQKQPNHNSPDNCIFCQAAAHAGVFVTPTIQLLVPTAWVMGEMAPARRTASVGTAAYDWQSRGPPLH